MEIWLDQNTPDAAIKLAGNAVFRADRTIHSGKNKAGSLCIYIITGVNGTVKENYFDLDIEYLILQCRSFYLPREITSVVITAVYVPPHPNTRIAICRCNQTALLWQQGTLIMPTWSLFRQNSINMKTSREKNTLDQVYCNISQAYKASPLPHLGISDHLSLSLIPTYKPPCTVPAVHKDHPQRQSKFGLRKPPQPCRTALKIQIREFSLRGQTWRDTHQLSLHT